MKRKSVHLSLALSLSVGSLLIILTLLGLPVYAADQCAAPGGAGSCLATIQAAIDNAGPGDTVRVVAGTYNENVVINKNLTLLGGFDDTGLGSRTPRSSIIDGGSNGPVIRISGGATVTVGGFTIRNGDGTTNNGQGGGIAVSEATAVIRDNLIEDNVASSDPAVSGFGGGIYVITSTNPVLIENNTIRANLAYSVVLTSPAVAKFGLGGGLWFDAATTAVINGNQILSNIAAQTDVPSTAAQGFGGGLGSGGDSLMVENNTIQDNLGIDTGLKGFGGGLVSFDTPVMTLTNNTIIQNTALISGTDAQGGGVYLGIFSESGQQLTLTGNWVVSNTAGITLTGSNNLVARGGGINVFGGGASAELLSMQDNHLVGNVAGRQLSVTDSGFAFGGGLFVEDISSVQLIDNEVVDNVGSYQVTPGSGFYGGGGGGIRLNIVTALLQGNVISGNTANLDGDAFGGGVAVDNGTVTMSQNRILGNRQNPTSSGGHGGLFASQSVVTSTNDIFARNFDGIGGINNSTLILMNDTLYANGNRGGSIGTNNSTMWVTNTIVAGHSEGLIEKDATATLIGNYNLLQNTNNYVDGATGGPNDIRNQNPLFRNAANDDFHLTGNSPAIDKGTSVGAPDVDFEGDSRPQDSAVDIGADEFKPTEIYLPLILK